MSQEDFAQNIGITRIKLQALESGRTKNPSAEDLVKFSEFYKISIDALLKVNIASLGEIKLRELEAGNDVYMAGGKLRVLAITVDKDNKENVEYVPIKAKAGYVKGYNDPDFIKALPKFSMPNLDKGTYRVFPITGDSMAPIPDNTDVTTKYIEDWKNIKPRTACVVILNGVNDFVFKLVTVNKDRTVLLESLNKEYKPYSVNVADILEVWQFTGYHAKELPEAGTDLDEIKRLIAELRVQLNPFINKSK